MLKVKEGQLHSKECVKFKLCCELLNLLIHTSHKRATIILASNWIISGIMHFPLVLMRKYYPSGRNKTLRLQDPVCPVGKYLPMMGAGLYITFPITHTGFILFLSPAPLHIQHSADVHSHPITMQHRQDGGTPEGNCPYSVHISD